MNIAPFSPCGSLTTVNATTAGGTNRQALSGSGGRGMYVRVCNKGTVHARIAFGGSTVDATTDTRAMTLLSAGERVFTLPDGTTHVDAATDSVTADVTFQIGLGV